MKTDDRAPGPARGMTPPLARAIGSGLATLPAGGLLVAYSGGMDSTLLLHVLAHCPQARRRGLRAVHVDHGLQPASRAWAEHCRAAAAALDVALIVQAVSVPETAGLGLEARARRARHAALRATQHAGEIVVFAQHLDDQAETVLLKLLRGAGPEGLGAMRPLRRFGTGHAWRPWLDVPRATLRAAAEAAALQWIDDPTNHDPAIDRSFLRVDILPRLTRRWPAAAASLAQSALWARQAADFIDAQARQALERIRGSHPATLHWAAWLALPEALRDPVLRHWLRALALPPPTRHQVAELARQLQGAREDRLPCVRWRDAELRRYRERLYALPPLQMPAPGWQAAFAGAELVLPADLGRLRLVGAGQPVRLARPLTVRFRSGGESLRLHADGPRRALRDLLQEAGIPPWQRARLPLLFDHEGRLLAVADLWLDVAGAELLATAGARLEWLRGPSARAVQVR